MAMVGFDDKWQDFPDYILGITKEIWEDRGLHTLHNYYSPDIIVRTPLAIVEGNQNVDTDFECGSGINLDSD